MKFSFAPCRFLFLLFSFLLASLLFLPDSLAADLQHPESKPAEIIESDIDAGKDPQQLNEQEHSAETVGQKPEVPGDSRLRTGPDGEAEIPITAFEQKGTPVGLEPVRVHAILQTDEYGRRISYPDALYADKVAKELYVIGTNGKGERSIYLFDKNYYPTAVLGSGRGIPNPRGLTVDHDGRIFVAWLDTSLNIKRSRLSILNAAFFKKKEIRIADSPRADSYEVKNVALENNGTNVYLAGYSQEEEGGKGALVLDGDGKFKRWLVPLESNMGFILGDDPTAPKALPVLDVVSDSNGRIYLLCPLVAKIFVLDSKANLLFTFGTQGGSTGKLSQPRSLAVDVKRQVIYVVDYMRHTILLYRYDGSYLFEIGGSGVGPGWFSYPTHVDVDWNGNLVVSDLFNHRVQVLDVR